MKTYLHSSSLPIAPREVEGLTTVLVSDDDGNPLVLVKDIPGKGLWVSKLGDDGFIDQVANLVPNMRVPVSVSIQEL